MWRSLIWKQWHEQAWRVAFASVTLSAMVGIGLWTRLMPDDQVLMLGVFGGAFVLPVFIAMGLIAPDRSDRTHATLLALPVHPAKTLAVATLAGLVATAIPLAAMFVVLLLVAGLREVSAYSLVELAATASFVSAMALVWTLCLTARLRSEAMVGLGGIGVITLWMLWAFVAEALRMMTATDVSLGFLLHPLAVPTLLPEVTRDGGGRASPGHVIAAAAAQAVIVAALWLWALRQYRRPEVSA